MSPICFRLHEGPFLYKAFSPMSKLMEWGPPAHVSASSWGSTLQRIQNHDTPSLAYAYIDEKIWQREYPSYSPIIILIIDSSSCPCRFANHQANPAKSCKISSKKALVSLQPKDLSFWKRPSLVSRLQASRTSNPVSWVLHHPWPKWVTSRISG